MSKETTSTTWQLARGAAERYQSILVPSILGPAAQWLVDEASLDKVVKVLDAGCGTGAAAHYVAQKLAPGSQVVGVDVNQAMLEVARGLPGIAGVDLIWEQADLGVLPFSEHAFDLVLCSQTLQFLAEPEKALNQLMRVLRPGGHFIAAVWAPMQACPYFEALVEAICDHISPEVAGGLGAAFKLSEGDAFAGIFPKVAGQKVAIRTKEAPVKLPPLDVFVPRHVSATPMGKGFANAGLAVQQRIVRTMATGLAKYAHSDGVTIPFAIQVAHVQLDL